MLSEYLAKVKDLETDLKQLSELINIPLLNQKIDELEHKCGNDWWTNVPLFQEYNKLKDRREYFGSLTNEVQDLKDLIQLFIEENEVMSNEIVEDYLSLKEKIDMALLDNMFTGEYDSNNVILTIHAGAGGKEAQDWASMLMRMYMRWAEKQKYKCTILDYLSGEEPKVCKHVTLEIKGKNAYGLLKNENGVHRMIRVSPFDSQNRRHTSFSAVEVMPEIETNNEIIIDPNDLRIDTYRSSGAGGQHVNKTESAIRITHLPTGIVTSCQTERSQHQNRDYAMKMLIAKLTQIKEQEHLDNISDIKGEQKPIQWGNQIRTYTFMPYQQVKDHRTNFESGNITAVLDGDINDFIYKSLAN